MFSFDNVSKDLDATIYAAHVRGILLYHIAVLQKAVSYGKLAKATGDMPSGGQLAQALARIAEHDHFAGKPFSTAIVVREDTGIPGSGFFNQCRKLGYDILDDPAAELLFWRESMVKLGVEDVLYADPISALLHRPISGQEEIKVLSSMWDIPEVTEPGNEQKVDAPNKLSDTALPKQLESQGDRVITIDQLCHQKTANEVVMSSDTVLLPASRLAVGDSVHLPDHASPFKVESVRRFSGPNKGVVIWTSRGRKFETDNNSHLKVDMPVRLRTSSKRARRIKDTTRLVT